MRTIVKYSVSALIGLAPVVLACTDSVAPDADPVTLRPKMSVAAAKKPASPSPDVAPPTRPILSATDVGRRYVALGWSSTDDRSSPIYYSITINGAPDANRGTWDKSRTYYSLEPATTYTFTVRARDYAGNSSVPSAPLSVTTRALDASDRQAPSAPTNVSAADFGSGDREFLVTWTESTDNTDAQGDLHYEVYLNGELSEVVAGKTQSRDYGNTGTNTISVIAVDANGNKSQTGTTTIVFNF